MFRPLQYLTEALNRDNRVAITLVMLRKYQQLRRGQFSQLGELRQDFREAHLIINHGADPTNFINSNPNQNGLHHFFGGGVAQPNAQPNGGVAGAQPDNTPANHP